MTTRIDGIKKYALCVKMYEGDSDPECRFTYLAANDDEAEEYALRWTQYQGLNWRDIEIRRATEEESLRPVHQDYIPK